MESVTLSVKITPGSKRNEVISLREGIWHIKVTAPPVEGKANEELIAYLSKLLGVRKGCLNVTKGQTSRNKLVSIDGISREGISLRLSAKLLDRG
jgi:hypothetical protein